MNAAAAGADVATFGGATPLRGRVQVPGDKGISHRALLFAALAVGDSTLAGLASGADVASTRAALDALGVVSEHDGDLVTLHGRGIDAWREPENAIDCGNSGTTMRMLGGVLAGRPFLSVLTGDASLRARPMARIVEPLKAMGAAVDGRAGGSLAPLVFRGGSLRGRPFDLAVASAQVKTALLLAGLQADGVTSVTEPSPSRDHTERMLATLGVPIDVDGTTVRVRAGAPGPFELAVPGDPSSAAFWCVAASITPGSEIAIERVAINPTRIAFVAVLRRMGASIDVEPTGEELGEPVGDLRVTAAPLRATTIGGDEIPLVQDEIPVLAVAAAFADGVTEITDAAELVVKESDRLATVGAVLTELGVGVESSADGLVIRGGRPHAGHFTSHGDHRVAMAAAVGAHAIDGASTVHGWRDSAVSYPEFLADLARLTAPTA
ncbi:MAG: 3-phosphoshikimate 1-carboxyvinyltransferase [Acidimicrobiia bacterium]